MRCQVHALGKTLAAGLLLLATTGVVLTDVTADADAAHRRGDDATAKVFYRSLAQQADSQAQTAVPNAPAHPLPISRRKLPSARRRDLNCA